MAIEATGPPAPVADAWGCTGAFVRVPVRLAGTLALRTGTRFFGTMRRTRLTGFVTFDAGAVDCARPAPAACERSASLSAGARGGSLLAGPRQLVLQFREPVGTAAWYHVMTIGGYDALTGALPSLGVAAPPGNAIRGSARFLARETVQSSDGTCSTTTTSGAASGTLRTSFAGWGARTLRLGTGFPASFRETS